MFKRLWSLEYEEDTEKEQILYFNLLPSEITFSYSWNESMF